MNTKLVSSDLECSSDSSRLYLEVGKGKYILEGRGKGNEFQYHRRDVSIEFLENIDKKPKGMRYYGEKSVNYEEKGNALRDSSGEKLNLTVWFCATWRPRSAVRKISCKASDYPIDIKKRVKNMYITNPDIQIKDLIISRHARNWRRSPRKNDDDDDDLPHRTLETLRVKDNECIYIYCRKYIYLKNVELDWIPLPVTGEDVWLYSSNARGGHIKRESFDRIVRKLGIGDRCRIDQMWGLIQSIEDELLCPQANFHKIFPQRDNFVDSFYQALLNTEIVLSESYILFFTEIERLVWQDFNIPPPEKEMAIMSEVNMAIKDAVLQNGYLNSRVAGVILCFYGKSAIRVPYSVNSRERFFLRKDGIEKRQLHLEKLIATEVVERAKNDIYKRLIMACLAECKDNLVCNIEVSVEYVLLPNLVRDTLSKHFFHRRAHAPDVRHKRTISFGSRPMIACDRAYKSLADHFKGDGFKVSEKFSCSEGPEYYDNRIIEADSHQTFRNVTGLRISWRSDEVNSFTDNSDRNTNLL